MTIQNPRTTTNPTHGACIGGPLSWLTLDQYLLGELSDEETRDVSLHLEHCPLCRACLSEARRVDEAPLPALVFPERRSTCLRWFSALKAPRTRPLWAALASAAAALLVAMLALHDPGPEADGPGRRASFKGGEAVLTLIRERSGQIRQDPEAFAPGDRFKVLITCPPPWEPRYEVIVLQGGEATYPLEQGRRLVCQNREPLPGAFTLDGQDPALVCVLLGDTLPAPRTLRLPDANALPPGTLCTRLHRVP